MEETKEEKRVEELVARMEKVLVARVFWGQECSRQR